jgi:subtilisin family serine protease
VCATLSAQDGIEPPAKPARVGKSYYRCNVRVKEWRKVVAEDERRAAEKAGASGESSRYRCIYRLWPDFPVQSHISRSVATVKADAAMRSFEATGEQIVWAVIDSGVSAGHPHFGSPQSEQDHVLLHTSVKDLHRCFGETFRQAGTLRVSDGRLPDPDFEQATAEDRTALIERHRDWALRDDFGHGTHVAGIIAGSAPAQGVDVVVLQREDHINEESLDDDSHARVKVTRARAVTPREVVRFHGVARDCRILSLRVLDHRGEGRSSDVIRALEYIRETVNDNPKVLRVHGVNLSVGYEFEAEMFACGQSPLCAEVNRLVQAGVVVVTAAGNTGYGTVSAQARTAKVGLSNTINDPGNAELAITVGATHRESPHTYGVSYFSSKGPTGDGRLKPDMVAPGERIISCAAGAKFDRAMEELEMAAGVPALPLEGAARPIAHYVEDTGTSMAAPHVSGAIAAFLSIRREFIGRPLDVKRIFLESAIPLGRERYFEGHGLLDLMKAIQSV